MGVSATIYATGDKAYWKDGKFHRVDGPAFISAEGRKEYWENGKLHRLDGPAIDDPKGTKEWHVDGQRHRSMGPAVEYKDGTKEWWLWNKRHRDDGPAVVHPNGTNEYWVHGKFLNELEFEQAIKDKKEPEPMSFTHPWILAYRITKAALSLDPKSTTIQDRYKMYMNAAATNHAAASYTPTNNSDVIKKYTAHAQEFERAAATLKSNYPYLCSATTPSNEEITTVPLTKRQFAKRLTQACLRGYYGGTMEYNLDIGFGKNAVDAMVEALDKVMEEIKTDDVSPDLKDLQSKQPLSNSSNIQIIRDPNTEPEITATEHDLPELRPVKDLNAKPFDDEMP